MEAPRRTEENGNQGGQGAEKTPRQTKERESRVKNNHLPKSISIIKGILHHCRKWAYFRITGSCCGVGSTTLWMEI